ncbi:hypothetical protein HNR60_001713 [Rhodopseudomonas rhenobacensis]|uniref:Uncharacterized protein n=1 Tax=Rhodopseudomonas rhenobacensis TaxID=87461 RepID=A0A7W7Z2X2_9BRAD|nr:hypothetical protein [Rhodopseudomonas rhenobacensis]MBB5046964.1 hypothetical protein [Rhodopseudomonas rhenobacensis]
MARTYKPRIRYVAETRAAQTEWHRDRCLDALASDRASDEKLREAGGAMAALAAALDAHGARPATPPQIDRDIGSPNGVVAFVQRREYEQLADGTVVVEQAYVAPARLAHDEAWKYTSHAADPAHAGLVAFMTASQERARTEHEARLEARAKKLAKRAAAAAKQIAVTLTADEEFVAAEKFGQAKKAAERARTVKQQVADLYRHGFYYPGGRIAGGGYDAFGEFLGDGVLRSHLDPMLAFWPQILPRKDRLRVGNEKTFVGGGDSKALMLTAPYHVLDMKRLGAIIVELDSNWTSVEDLMTALREKFESWAMPNFITGRMDHGQFVRPHLIWILEQTVWNDVRRQEADADGNLRWVGDKRCRKAPIDFYHRIQRALVGKLIDLGADPAQHNVYKTKGATSPFFTCVIANGVNRHRLGRRKPAADGTVDARPCLMDALDLHVDEADMARRAHIVRSQIGSTPSNEIWNRVGAELMPTVYRELAISRPEFVAAGSTQQRLAGYFDSLVRPALEAELGASDELDRILDRRTTFAARYCAADKHKERTGRRGRDRDTRFTMPTAEERQQEAGRRSREQNSDVLFQKYVIAVKEAMKATGCIRKPAFIKAMIDSKAFKKSYAYNTFEKACHHLGIEFHQAVGRYIVRPASSTLIKTSCPSNGQSRYRRQTVRLSPTENGRVPTPACLIARCRPNAGLDSIATRTGYA